VQHRGCDEQVGNLARVASCIVLRHDPLIHLKYLQVVPMNAQGGAARGASATACARRSGQ
jgi:hypothetical protein